MCVARSSISSTSTSTTASASASTWPTLGRAGGGLSVRIRVVNQARGASIDLPQEWGQLHSLTHVLHLHSSTAA